MKKPFNIIITVILLAVLSGKLLSLILNFSDNIKQILNTVMFCIIGVAYIFFSFGLQNKVTRTIMILSGLFLIIMNFIPENTLTLIAGIVCLVTPILIAGFSKEKNQEEAPNYQN